MSTAGIEPGSFLREEPGVWRLAEVRDEAGLRPNRILRRGALGGSGTVLMRDVPDSALAVDVQSRRVEKVARDGRPLTGRPHGQWGLQDQEAMHEKSTAKCRRAT